MKPFVLLLFLPSIILGQITFDADFESGNLKSVSTTDSVEYNVETNEDIGGRWFYFRISGVKDKKIRVNVITQPHDFTKAMYSYDNLSFYRFSDEESPAVGSFEKLFEEDTVYVAYYTPYTYSFLQERISSWKNSPFLSVDTIGYTSNLFPIQELVITDNSVPDSEKLTVWIHARTHPGETPSSWHFEGIINELLSNDEVINYYLKKIKFHLIPFVNPDGVYFGRSRTNFNFIDLESNWDKLEVETAEEVKILRARMKELNDIKPFSVFLNLHSQASSYCTFWIHTASSTSENFYLREYQFSNLNVSDNPYFLKSDYSESNLRSRYPEGWLWNNYGEQVMALTYETPYNNYFKNDDENIEVTNENLAEIGRRTVYAISEYLNISHPKHYLMDNSVADFIGDAPTNYQVTTEFYGNDFAVLEPNKNTRAIYETDELPSGKYDLAGWWASSEGNSFQTEFEITTPDSSFNIIKTQKANGGQWNYLTTIELKTKGKISITLQTNSTGLVVADAFRLIHIGNITEVSEQNILPNLFTLYQNYPNPFNPATTIRYSISSDNKEYFSSQQHIVLTVFDILGREVVTLVDEYQSPGKYEVIFNASQFNLASGNYIYRLQVGKNVITKKMVLMK